MEYQIQQLAKLAGVSSRTLRYYDEIDLLPPHRVSAAGYRIYSTIEVDRLQQILSYRALGIPLAEIKKIMEDPRYHAADVLKRQLAHVENELAQLEMQKKHLKKTLAYYKGEVQMNDQEKFETWKQQQLSKNEKLYGKEIRKHYGDEQANRAQQHWGKLSAAQYQAMQAAKSELLDALDKLLAKEVELPSPLAEKAFQAHRRWLMLAAPDYTPAYHRALAQMYAADERFAAYYNQKTEKYSVELLQKIIEYYTTH